MLVRVAAAAKIDALRWNGASTVLARRSALGLHSVLSQRLVVACNR